MDRFRADLSAFADITDQITRFAQRLDAELEVADRRVDQLHTTWAGESAEQHRQAHTEWQNGAAEMRAGLAEMLRNAQTAHANYGNAVQANSRMWEQAR